MTETLPRHLLNPDSYEKETIVAELETFPSIQKGETP
jgi:hypothetical protein